jgi:hypothetical protein
MFFCFFFFIQCVQSERRDCRAGIRFYRTKIRNANHAARRRALSIDPGGTFEGQDRFAKQPRALVPWLLAESV